MSNFTDFTADILAALNVSAITNLLDTYFDTETTSTIPALWGKSAIPENFDGHKSINFYRTGPINNTIEYGTTTYSASCRAVDEATSISIAAAVVNGINRVNYSGYSLKTSILMPIPPADPSDNYNTPVEITIYKR